MVPCRCVRLGAFQVKVKYFFLHIFVLFFLTAQFFFVAFIKALIFVFLVAVRFENKWQILSEYDDDDDDEAHWNLPLDQLSNQP